jgi:hypothetical protein
LQLAAFRGDGLARCKAGGTAGSSPLPQVLGIRAAAARHPRCKWARSRDRRGLSTMADLIFVASTVVFFAASLAYVAGCDRL